MDPRLEKHQIAQASAWTVLRTIFSDRDVKDGLQDFCMVLWAPKKSHYSWVRSDEAGLQARVAKDEN